MSSEFGDHGAYVKRVREETQKYIQELLADNDRLRRLMARFETDSNLQRLENERLTDELQRQAKELERFRLDHVSLASQLEAVERENVQFTSRFVEVEQRNNDLANLYVASYRLHETLDRKDVLTAIQEIVINLIGCEEFAVFEMSEDGNAFERVASFGLPDGRLRRVPVGHGVIGRVGATGTIFIGEEGDAALVAEEHDLTACVPLRIESRVIGLIVLFRLLPQKGGRLAPIDSELFDLLASQAALAMYCTMLHARYGSSAAVS